MEEDDGGVEQGDQGGMGDQRQRRKREREEGEEAGAGRELKGKGELERQQERTGRGDEETDRKYKNMTEQELLRVLQEIGGMDGGRKGLARAIRTDKERVVQASRKFQYQAKVEPGSVHTDERPMAYLIRRAVDLGALRRDLESATTQPGCSTRGAGGRRMQKNYSALVPRNR